MIKKIKFAQFLSDKTNRVLNKMEEGMGGMLANNLFDWQFIVQ